MSNEWFDNGEFPPAGIQCLVFDDCEWRETSIVGMDGDGYCVYTVTWNEDREYEGDCDWTSFKPLKSEREETIERMCNVINMGQNSIAMSFCADLYDAGLRFKEDNQDV